jgi:hypothetical protein
MSENDPLLPFGEYRPDVSDYEQSYTDELLNVLPRSDGYGPFPSFTGLASSLGTPAFSNGFSNGFSIGEATACRGFFRAINTDGSVTTFMGTSERLYKLDATSFTWTDVSKGGVAYTALSSTDNWQFVQYINDVIAVQANVAPQVYSLTSPATFVDLTGSPPQSRYISVVGDFVVLSGQVSNPYRVQWSALGDPTGWTAGVNSSDFQDLPDGGIVRGVAGGEYGNIFQDTMIRRMIYAPGSDVIFQIERITEDLGIYAPYSLTRSGNLIFWVAAQGFMKMVPTGYPEPIGKERIDRTLLAGIDNNNLQLCIGASDPRNHRIFLAYKSAASSAAGQFDKILCYDYALDRFTPVEINGQYIGSISQPGVTLENLDSINSSIDGLPSSLDSFSQATLPQLAMFDATGALGFLRGTPLEAVITTAALAKPGRLVFVRALRPASDAPIVYGSVGKRLRLTDTETFTTETVMDATGNCPQRASTRYARGKLRIPAGTSWTFALGVEPDVSLEGAR